MTPALPPTFLSESPDGSHVCEGFRSDCEDTGDVGLLSTGVPQEEDPFEPPSSPTGHEGTGRR